MIKSSGKFAGFPVTLVCDGKCKKAWGINARQREFLSDDEDDFYFLADDEIAEDAPEDPGSYEGGHAKPRDKVHNKWCCRECERSTLLDAGKDVGSVDIDRFTKRVYNRPRKDKDYK